MSTASAPIAPPHKDGLERQLGWLDASAIYVGIILGSGIFFAPQQVAAATASPWVAAGLWLAGGLVATCGGLCYAECGARLPCNGGFYAYYRAAYGEPVAFVGGWAALAITYPASLAAIAHVLALYLVELLPEGLGLVRLWAVVAVLAAGTLNVIGVRAGANTQRVLTSLKVSALVLLCLAALLAPAPAPALVEGVAPAAPASWLPLGAAGILFAMVGLLFTYDGWSDVTLVGGELRHPGRDLGRTVIVGTLLLAGLYVLVQAAVMTLLPHAEAAASKQVVADAVAAGLGPRAGRLVALLVVVSTFGAINGIVLTSSRLAYAMAIDGVFFGWFAAVSPRRGTPARSVGVIIAASIVYVAVSSLNELLDIFSFNVWIFYAATAVALLLLRRRRAGEPLDFRAPGGWLAPAVVLLTAAGMTFGLALGDPLRRLQGLVLLLAGVPAYLVWRWVQAKSRVT